MFASDTNQPVIVRIHRAFTAVNPDTQIAVAVEKLRARKIHLDAAGIPLSHDEVVPNAAVKPRPAPAGCLRSLAELPRIRHVDSNGFSAEEVFYRLDCRTRLRRVEVGKTFNNHGDQLAFTQLPVAIERWVATPIRNLQLVKDCGDLRRHRISQRDHARPGKLLEKKAPT